MSGRATKISGGQLFSLLIVIRAGVIMTESFAPGGQAIDSALFVHCCLEYALLALCLLPVLLLRKLSPDESLLQTLQRTMGKPIAYAAGLLLVLYFLAVTALYDVRFLFFVNTAIDPTLPVKALTIILLLSCAYIAARGLEALARTAAILAPMVLAAIVFILFLPLNFSHFDYLLPGVYTLDGEIPLLIKDMARNTGLAALGLLLPHVKGTLSRPLFAYLAIAFASALAVVYMITTIFGGFATSLIFPFYTLSTLRDEIVFFRLDVVCTAVWLMGLLTQIATALIAITVTVRHFFPKLTPGVITAGTAILVTASTWAFDWHGHIQQYEGELLVLSVGFLVVTFALPLAAVVSHCLRGKRRKTSHKKSVIKVNK